MNEIQALKDLFQGHVLPEEGQIIMRDPEDMVRAIKEHVEKTGDKIESADDPYGRIGFQAIGPTGVVSWMLPVHLLRKHTWDNPALKEDFKTRKGRILLAQTLSMSHVPSVKMNSSAPSTFELACDEKDLLGFKRDNLLHKQLPIYDLDVPIGVVSLDAEGQVRVTPCEKGRWDGTPFLKLQDPKATAKAYLDTLRPQYGVGPDWILAPRQAAFVFDTGTGKSLFFCVDNPVLYSPGEVDSSVPNSSYLSKGYRFKTMEEALRVGSDEKHEGGRWVQRVSFRPTAFLEWEEGGHTYVSGGGDLPPAHLEYKVVHYHIHQTEESKPAETPESNSLGSLFGFAIGTALLASSLKKPEEPTAETRVASEVEKVSGYIVVPETGEKVEVLSMGQAKRVFFSEEE